jgi:hypothetical protein
LVSACAIPFRATARPGIASGQSPTGALVVALTIDSLRICVRAVDVDRKTLSAVGPNGPPRRGQNVTIVPVHVRNLICWIDQQVRIFALLPNIELCMPEPTPLLLEICERGVTLATCPAWALSERVVVTSFDAVADVHDPGSWRRPSVTAGDVTYLVRGNGVPDITMVPLERNDRRLALLEVEAPTMTPFVPAQCGDASAKPDADREWFAIRRDRGDVIHRIGGVVISAGTTILLRLYTSDGVVPGKWRGAPVVQANQVVGTLTGEMLRAGTLSAISVDVAFELLPDATMAEDIGELHSGFVVAGLREVARVLFRPRQWARDVRLVNWRLKETFAVSTLDSELLSDGRVVSLLARCLLGPVFLVVALTLLVWFARGFLSLSADWMCELSSHLAFAASAALLAGLCFAVTANVAAGMASSTIGGIVGILTAIVSVKFIPTARGYLTGGLTCGAALGAALAILRRDAPLPSARQRARGPGSGLAAVIDTMVLLLMIGALGWLLSVAVGNLLADKALNAKTSGAALGVVAGIPVILAGWLRRRKLEHGRDTTKARTLVRTMALAVSTLGGLAGIIVGPNCDAHTPLCSGAIGVLAGGLTGGIFGLLLVTTESALGVARSAIVSAVAGIGVLALLFVLGTFSGVSHEYKPIVMCTAIGVVVGVLLVLLLGVPGRKR